MTIPTHSYVEKRPAVVADARSDQLPIVDPNSVIGDGDHVLLVDPVVVGSPAGNRHGVRRRCVMPCLLACMTAMLGISLICLGVLFIGWATTGGRTPDEGLMYPERLIDVSDNADEDGVFRRTCVLPYNSLDPEIQDIMRTVQRALDIQLQAEQEPFPSDDAGQYFLEHFAVGIDKEDADDAGFAMVTVPTFRDGRRGRFLHDFTFNQSLIVDKSKAHCFVMPLDHETVMKPRNMLDMIVKMNDGYYNIDTNVVRKNMRVVLPAVNDTSDLAPRILAECEGMQIFRLEPITGRVFKRSVDNLPDSAKFAHFSGHNIVEMNLDNYQQLKQHLNKRK